MIRVDDCGADGGGAGDGSDGGEDLRIVTLARPDRRNALTVEGLDALERAITETDASVVYLRGEGPAFCAGADLDVVSGLDREAAEAFAEQGQRVANSIESADSVVVAGVDGAARGGGVELALACDLRVATPEATFAEPGVKLGLFGAWGGTVRLPRVLGEGEALDLALSGRTVDAEEALRMGLVSRVTDDPRAVADELAENDPETLRVVKSRMRDRSGASEQEAREAEAFGRLVERHANAIAEERGE
ncbi:MULTISPECIES: enoyl-CoA hydratase/isomerase family protein [Halorussus]|uniref:enoyl-CoA hydratase/isomerase family protein n=1 Tax=Halorussus TaxID=1070314 RepID=UPI00209EB968|nr:enoyl-CoA hydratase/isomerase family protein [Halorussus vallis]USZ77558.1 enoyl-CoA hydratase/isomerase family protein [Halorussus vallis]